MTKPTRTYKRGNLTVEWRAELCTHCEGCITGLPEVFDLNKRPWVNLAGATVQQVWDQCCECPSGALRAIIPEE